MSYTVQHKRSSEEGRRPMPSELENGQLGININSETPGIFFKTDLGGLVKAGPAHVGTSAPTQTNYGERSVGELWLDTSSSPDPLLKVWTGERWDAAASQATANYTYPSGSQRTVQNRLEDYVSVKDFGAVGDGVADDTAAIQAAIDSFKPFPAFGTGGSKIYFPAGIYKLTSALDLTGCNGLQLIGSGELSTELRQTANVPIISSINPSSAPVNTLTITGFTLRGGGNANNNAHGVRVQFSNNCALQNCTFFGCYYAIYLNNSWQYNLTNLDAHGGGDDQSRMGLVLGESAPGFVDNAVVAQEVFIKDTIECGFRIIQGQGSKFTSCEAGSTPRGYWIGESPQNTLCQWLHFTNCLADSVSEYGWYIAKGSADELSEMHFANCWSGNCVDPNFFISGAKNLTFTNSMIVTARSNAISIQGSERINFTSTIINKFNFLNDSSHAVRVDGSSRITFSGTASTSNDFASPFVSETGSSSLNRYDLPNEDRTDLGTVIGSSELKGGTGKVVNGVGLYSFSLSGSSGEYLYLRHGSSSPVFIFDMPTSTFIPPSDGTGRIGAPTQKWGNVYADNYILESPDGTSYRLKVANGGALSTELA